MKQVRGFFLPDGEQHLVPTIKALNERMKASRRVGVLKKAAGF